MLIQEIIVQRVHQRMKVDGNALVVDSPINTLGNIGYRMGIIFAEMIGKR